MGTTGTADRAAAAFAAYRDGEPGRMAELVEAATPAMWHTARAVGLDRAQAEDAVQMAWAQLVARASSVRDPQGVLSWLITTTRRCAIRLSQQSGRALPVEDVAGTADRQPTGPAAPVAEAPEEVALRTERDRTLWRHVQGLSPRCRELLRVVAFADRPDYASIAVRLGMPVGSIGPTRGRCLASLRNALAADPGWGTP